MRVVSLRTPVIALLLALAAACPAHAQEDAAEPPAVAAQAEPRTGSDWIDARLLDMNDYAARYRDAFVDEIVRYHQAPRALVEEALADEGMSAGDVYFACALAQAIGRPCRAVVDVWRSDSSDGWQGVAERLDLDQLAGIHRRIRSDITESYARWARPLDPGAPPTR